MHFNNYTWQILKITLYLFGLTASILYLIYFEPFLKEGNWLDINNYTRIVIPDTFLYSNIIDKENLIQSMIDSGVKNTIGPSAIWYLTNENWYLVTIINWVIIYYILVYIERASIIYDIERKNIQLSIIIFLISPATIYYSIGSLKELPMMLLLLMSVYFYINKKLIPLTITIIILIIFRYQLIVIFTFIFSLNYFKKNNILGTITILLIFTAIYPTLNTLNIFSASATALYREEHGGAGFIGALVENIRSNTPVASTIAILIRSLQSLFEPFLTLVSAKSFFENGYLSIFSIIQFLTILFISPFIFKYFKNFTI